MSISQSVNYSAVDDVHYGADLKTLVDYQVRRGRTVRFQMTVLRMENQTRVVVHALETNGLGIETRKPLLEHTGIGRLALWESFAYIKVVTGGLKRAPLPSG